MDKNPFLDSNEPRKALVVFKKSRLDFVKEHGSKAEKSHLSPLIPAHEKHQQTIAAVEKVLLAFGIQFESICRSLLSPEKLKDRLVITIGGDGTLLDASHHCLDSAILGVNSDPKSSVGALCLADKDSFAQVLADILAGTLKPSPMARLKVAIAGQEQTPLALNDILFCHKNPAAMARFFLSLGNIREHHRSSGLWVASAVGSTGGIFSSGASPIEYHKHQALFHVREPYASEARPKLLSGLFGKDEILLIESDMGEGRLFIDGPHRALEIDFGQQIAISLSTHPLWLFDGPSIDRKRNEIIKYRQEIHKLL